MRIAAEIGTVFNAGCKPTPDTVRDHGGINAVIVLFFEIDDRIRVVACVFAVDANAADIKPVNRLP